jgi:hypothetical protein
MATNNTLNTTNVSNLIPPEINATVNIIKNPKSFGDQAKEYAKQKAIQAALGVADKLRKEIEDVVKKRIDLEVKHFQTLYDLSLKANPPDIIQNGEITKGIPILTEQEYQEAVAIENRKYIKAVELFEKILNGDPADSKNYPGLRKKLLDVIVGPYNEAKQKLQKLKNDLNKRKNRSKEQKAAARKKRWKSLKNFAKKTLVPILTIVITEELVKIIAQSDRLQDLVDQTNTAIQEADTTEKIDQSRVLRDNALRAINDVERGLTSITKQVAQYQLYIQIFDAIITVILSIPIPTSVPPGIGIPVNFILKLQKLLMKADKIISGISAVISIVLPILEDAIFILEDLKLQLLDINSLVDEKTINNLSDNQLSTLFNQINNTTKPFEKYKGFDFAIKTEENLGANIAKKIKEFKRHYAVAIDRDGVDVLKSDYSFTLDPNDLVEQLKLVIDQKNLQG